MHLVPIGYSSTSTLIPNVTLIVPIAEQKTNILVLVYKKVMCYIVDMLTFLDEWNICVGMVHC